jgi:hypothetical protein
MKIVDSQRRQIVMAVLLGLAAAGAGIRHWADNPSLARDIGTLLLVLWLPAVGNLVAFAVRKLAPRLRRADGFDPDSPFKAHVLAQIIPIQTGAAAIRPAARDLVLVIGQEGFRARTTGPLAATAETVELELLRPGLALPRLGPDAAFQVMVGGQIVANGRIRAAASS